jgi:phage-related protein
VATYARYDIHYKGVSPKDRPLAWLHGAVKTPPFSRAARLEAGFLLRRLQRGELLSMPQSRPMPSIGARCHELRINDGGAHWRVIYRIDTDAIVNFGDLRQKDRSYAESSDRHVP